VILQDFVIFDRPGALNKYSLPAVMLCYNTT
jgi:hypothetical protein